MSDLNCDLCGGSGKQYELYEEPGDDITCSKCGGHGFDPELVGRFFDVATKSPILGRYPYETVRPLLFEFLSVVRERLER